ncbi:MAG: pyruvate carboxylase [Bacteroidota bacterium]
MKRRAIKKLLVANRGEISIRIFRAASELNIQTVAIYSYEDRYSLHRYKADQAFQIGSNNDALKPYLDIDLIIELAKAKNIDAIHPGYGFLSENPNFARACIENDIIWIGPDPETMESLGNKIKAKAVAKKVGVPIVPASEDAVQHFEELEQTAKNIGFPVMIKAAFGGGGRGMRVVRKLEELETNYLEAISEAKTAFGNTEVFVEKFIDNPKHIEIQVIGDHYGNIVHLYERDCSVQRRFQKIVEVAPALSLSDHAKNELYSYALALAKALNYKNAGTIEFLVDKDENIYFIEVNTRLQVEHTITETVTGIDIVRAQILIAQHIPLADPLLKITDQSQVQLRGYAIQCRITTEDPMDDFRPDYGQIVTYRSAGGFGIRLDAGNAYAGAIVSPFFDSLLVKVTAWGNELQEASSRLIRSLKEFRIRGVKNNIGFLINILEDENFLKGQIHVNYIKENKELFKIFKQKNRGTKLLKYLASVNVNGHPGIKDINHSGYYQSIPEVVEVDQPDFHVGTKNLLDTKGRDALIQYVKNSKRVLFTDTTFRDAHQSLLATRVRSFDMLNIAESYAKAHGADLFSMEMWGGATFDVSMRFLKESPWKRLESLRQKMPNVLFQMLLRGANAVGYSAYSDNVIRAFIIESWEKGIDVFRIFDSLNWFEAMRLGIDTIVKETDAIAEACICYTGNLLSKEEKRFTLQYYLDLARQIEDSGAHMLAIKDMAGLLKPAAAELLIAHLKETVDMPIHLHTHDTSSIQSTTYMAAVKAGVDIIDVAISSMSGLTSQPNFNSLAAILEEEDGQSRNLNLKSLNKYSDYWKKVRRYYYPFEVELRAGMAKIYEYEIPGGQYTNLKQQAQAFDLVGRFDEIKENYANVNKLLGGIVKVTPSSKVVGDMAIFMTKNNYTLEDLKEKGNVIDFPESFKALMRGDLGQWSSPWDEKLQKDVLKGEIPKMQRPGELIPAVDLKQGYEEFKREFSEMTEWSEYLSYLLYPEVFTNFYQHWLSFGDVSKIPTPAFFYGLQPGEEIIVEIAEGKNLLIEYLFQSKPDKQGNRLVYFRLNGKQRTISIKDINASKTIVSSRKAVKLNEVGAPIQGRVSKIYVKAGDKVEINTPLFVIEAMKMENTITATQEAEVASVFITEKTMVEQDDIILELK